MFRWIFDKLLTVVLAVGYIPIYLGYGGKAMDARKQLGKDKGDLLATFVLAAAVIFWAVRLAQWLGENRPVIWETAVVYGCPALYVLWFVFARIRGKKLIRQAAQQAPRTESKQKSGEETINITFNHVSTSSDSQISKKDFIIPEKEKAPEVPLTEDMLLGSHHVSGTNAHIGMTVRYVAATHSVIYCHWSDKDPEKEEVFPIPDHIRTKQALLDYVQRSTSIPCVWMY